MVTKVRGSVIDFPGVAASIPFETTYPAGTVVFNSSGTSPVGWRFTGTVWEAFGESKLSYSATYDPPSISPNSYISTVVTVSGASLGDCAKASFSLDITGCVIHAFVSALNTVTVIIQNLTSGSINLSSGTLRVTVERK